MISLTLLRLQKAPLQMSHHQGNSEYQSIRYPSSFQCLMKNSLKITEAWKNTKHEWSRLASSLVLHSLVCTVCTNKWSNRKCYSRIQLCISPGDAILSIYLIIVYSFFARKFILNEFIGWVYICSLRHSIFRRKIQIHV